MGDDAYETTRWQVNTANADLSVSVARRPKGPKQAIITLMFTVLSNPSFRRSVLCFPASREASVTDHSVIEHGAEAATKRSFLASVYFAILGH